MSKLSLNKLRLLRDEHVKALTIRYDPFGVKILEFMTTNSERVHYGTEPLDSDS